MNLKQKKRELIDYLKKQRYIRSQRVWEAFMSVPRESFIPPKLINAAYADRPLSIGEGQTISAPHMVAIMTEALAVSEESKILEVGTGSGYQAAILARLAPRGHVHTVERKACLAEKAKTRFNELSIRNVSVYVGDGTEGLADKAPFNRIIVTAGSPHVPEALKNQLYESARMLIPQGDRYSQRLLQIDKTKQGFVEKNLGGCVFVPLIGKGGWIE